MSHVTDVKVEINDLECLELAAKKLGLYFNRGQEKYRWYGYSVGDYPMPAGYTRADLGKCLHAIGIPGNNKAYEIGVVERRDGKPGWTLHFDFWQGGYGIQDRVGKDCTSLIDQYACEVAKKEAVALGYSVMSENMLADGTIELMMMGG